jgi:hypothetical protein
MSTCLTGKSKKELQVSRTICGKLMKKSGNKYQLSLQVRLVYWNYLIGIYSLDGFSTA